MFMVNTQQPTVAHKHSGGVFSLALGITIGAALALLVFLNMQTISDWWKLRDYAPTARIVALADGTTMSDEARKLFYVNHPQLLTGSAFSSYCQLEAEKTVVLGCYLGGDRGIYLYEVTEERLRGVVETTAAHEMLHVAYDRLSGDEKQYVDGLLVNFYSNGLQDERVKQTIEAYKLSEPDELVNEMHSIFATEVALLPQELETYYKTYFANRGTVVAMAGRYQAEFTSRREQAAAYDAQLAVLNKQIEENQITSTARRQSLERESVRMQAMQRSGDVASYNRLVDTYNASVQTYNSLLATTRNQIEQYNQIVEQRNAVALEERALAQALTNQSIEQ